MLLFVTALVDSRMLVRDAAGDLVPCPCACRTHSQSFRNCQPSLLCTSAALPTPVVRNELWSYVTLLDVGENFKVPLANLLTMHYSLRHAGAQQQLTVAHSQALPCRVPSILKSHGMNLHRVETALAPHTKGHGQRTFGKLALWGLTRFDLIVTLDLDMIIRCNLDGVFSLLMADLHHSPFAAVPELFAYAEEKNLTQHNSGLTVLRPNKTTAELMMQALQVVQPLPSMRQYGDQEFAFWFFTHLQPSHFLELPTCFNAIRYRNRMNVQGSAHACVWHLTGSKPFSQCHKSQNATRLRDCNRPGSPFYDPFLFNLWWKVFKELKDAWGRGAPLRASRVKARQETIVHTTLRQRVSTKPPELSRKLPPLFEIEGR